VTPAFFIAEQCHYCSKFRSPLDIIYMPGGVKICIECERRHQEALDALSTGKFTGECSECGKSAEELRSATGQMAAHFENGRYRMMCAACDRTYVPKRREMYGDTEFGHQLKLK
jgi:hypothetical protein